MCVCDVYGALVKYLHVVSPGQRKNAANLDTHWQFSCGAVQILTVVPLVLVLQAKEVTLCTRGWQISLASSASGEDGARNEGVGILLDPKATVAWRDAGEVWKAVSSRLVTAKLKRVGKGQRKHGGSRETSNMFVSIVCAYAPTARAPPGVKVQFCSDLQVTLDQIPQNDILVVVGDFNARVGVLKPGEDSWHGVIGKHGLDERNMAGEEFLQFCAVNQLTVMNTWFQKKDIYFGTWMHPATKKHHMIDLIAMRAAQSLL